jgi:hypothetical protein
MAKGTIKYLGILLDNVRRYSSHLQDMSGKA